MLVVLDNLNLDIRTYRKAVNLWVWFTLLFSVALWGSVKLAVGYYVS